MSQSNTDENETEKENQFLQTANRYLKRSYSLSDRFQVPLLKQAISRLEEGKTSDLIEKLQKIENNLPPHVDLDFHDIFYLEFMYGEKGRDIDHISQYVFRLEHVLKDHPELV